MCRRPSSSHPYVFDTTATLAPASPTRRRPPTATHEQHREGPGHPPITPGRRPAPDIGGGTAPLGQPALLRAAQPPPGPPLFGAPAALAAQTRRSPPCTRSKQETSPSPSENDP